MNVFSLFIEIRLCKIIFLSFYFILFVIVFNLFYSHGINKRFTRRAQKFKQATGLAIEPTHDLLFEALNMKFEEQQEYIRQLARDVQGWVRHVKIGFDHLQQLACSMESLYGSWGGVRVKSLNNISEFNTMASHLSCNLSRELVCLYIL